MKQIFKLINEKDIIDMVLNRKGIYIPSRRRKTRKEQEEIKYRDWIEQYNENYAHIGVFL